MPAGGFPFPESSRPDREGLRWAIWWDPPVLRETGNVHSSSRIARSTIIFVDPLRTGARLLSKGMRGGNGALTLLGALLAARGIVRWLERPDRELLYSKRLKPGQRLEIRVPKED